MPGFGTQGSRWVRLLGLMLVLGASTAAARADAPTASPRADPGPELGVNADLLAYSPAALEAILRRLAAAGIHSVRQPVRWAEMEPEPGRVDWRGMDRVSAALARHDMRLLATVHTAPAWARHDPPVGAGWWVCDDPAVRDPAAAANAPPTDPGDLARFVARFGERYRAQLTGIEVWHEPNLLPNWRQAGPMPEDYARLLTVVAGALRSAAPAVPVISAGLAPTTEVNVCHLSDVVFLDRLARTGALAEVDAVGIEPFGLRTGPTDWRADREVLNFSRASVLHDVLRRQGVDRPLWAVAWGWNALPPGWSGPPSPWGSHSPAVAAAWTREAWARARAEWPWLGAMYLWHLQPRAAADDPIWGFALLDAGGRPTALWDAAVDVAAGRVAAARTAPPRPLNVSLVIAVLSAALATVMMASRRRALGIVRPALAPFARLSPTPAALAYGAAVLADAVVPWPLALVTLPFLVLLAAVHPLVALAAVAAVAPLYFGVTLQLGPSPIGVVELLVLVALSGRVLAAYVAWPEVGPPSLPAAWRSFRRACAGLDWAVVALVIWAGLSPLWSEQTGPALREWRTVILVPAVYYGLLRTAADRRAAARAALTGLVLGALVAATWALAGLGQFARGDSAHAVPAEGVIRVRGPYGSPNNLALLLGRVSVVLAAIVLLGAPRWRRWGLVVAIPVAAALFLTFSRGALLVGLPLIVVYLAVLAGQGHRRGRSLAAALMVLLIVAALLLPFAGTERLAETLAARPGSTLFTRLRLWESSLEMLRDHPLLGVGLDNFLYLYRDRYVKRDVIQEAALNHPHNALLDWWTRLGLPGVALFLVLVAGNLRAGWTAIGRGPPDRALAVAALGMQVYALAHGLVDNHFFLIDLAIVWWIAQATLLAVATDSRT